MCPFAELTPGRRTRFEVDGLPVAVVRIGDDVYAIGDTCTHGEVSLSEGEVWCDERELECWKHGSTFSLVTGEPQTLPATVPVPVYVARVVDGMVEVDVDARRSTEPMSTSGDPRPDRRASPAGRSSTAST